MLGLMMQRALLILWAVCVPLVAFLRNINPFLAMINLPPEVVEGASLYLRIVAPALFANAVSSVLSRWDSPACSTKR